MASAPAAVSLAALRPLLGKARHGFVRDGDAKAAGPAASFAVKVTNTGAVDADDVVLGFLTPPGAGKDGVPLQTLFGFERVHVPAGQSVNVYLYPEHTDFMHTALDGTKTAAAGEWTVQFGVAKTLEHGMGYAEAKLTTL